MNRAIFLICTMLAIAALGGEFIIDLPTQDVSGRVLAIELSGEQLRALGGHAAWLRLYDAQGKVIPWAREQVSTTKLVRTRAQTPITIQEARKPADGTLEITFGLKTDAAVPEQAFLVFRTSLRNFEQTVQLWGLLPDGSDRALITDGFLFDSTDNIVRSATTTSRSTSRCSTSRAITRIWEIVHYLISWSCTSTTHFIMRSLSNTLNIRIS